MIYNSGSLTRFIEERPDVSQYYISEWNKFRKNLSKQTSEILIFESSDDWHNFVNRNKDKNIDPSVYMGEELKKAYSRLQNSPERLDGQLPKTFPGSHYSSIGIFSLSFSPFSFRKTAGIMENDPRYKRLEEALRIKWLAKDLSNKETIDYFHGRLDGPKTKTLKEDVGSEFRQKYENEAKKYDEGERLIYKNPTSDPVITLLNKQTADHARAIYYDHQHSFATIEEKQKSLLDVYKNTEERGWDNFVMKHPEKAREYSLEKYKNYSKYILNAIERNRQKEVVQQTTNQPTAEPIRPGTKTEGQPVLQKTGISHRFVGPINTAREDTTIRPGFLKDVSRYDTLFPPATTARDVFGPKKLANIFFKNRFFSKLTDLYKRYAVNKKTLSETQQLNTAPHPISNEVTTILERYKTPEQKNLTKNEVKARSESIQARANIQKRVKENRLGILFRKLKSRINQPSEKSADKTSGEPQQPHIRNIRSIFLQSFNPQIYQTEAESFPSDDNNNNDGNFGQQGNNESPRSPGNSGNHPGRHSRPNAPHWRPKKKHIPHKPRTPKLLSTLKKARTALSLIQLLPIIIPILIMVLTLLFVVGFGGGGFGGIGGGETGGTPPPGGTIGGGGLDYSIPFRDKSVAPKDIKNIILSSFPNAKIQNWETIVSKSILNGWNPAFVLALWIEETGAQGASSYSDPLGCDPSKPTTDINISLKCLFDSFNSYSGNQFADFMCTYGGDGFHKAPCIFNVENPNFPGNIKSWYSQLVPDGPGAIVKISPPPSSTGFSVSCPLSNPVIMCGTYNTIVNTCGHGNTSVGYSPCNPSIYSECPYSEQLKNAIDVDVIGGNSANAPVMLPFINNQPVNWTKTSNPIPIAGGSWGYKIVYTTSYNGHNFSLDLTHINSNVNSKNVSSSGEQAGTIFPNLDGIGIQHLHTALSFDGKWVDAIRDAKLCISN